MEWSSDLKAAEWLTDEVRTFAKDVRSLIPAGFDGYARIFHPLSGAPHRRWTDRATTNGRISHAEMQWQAISREPPTRSQTLSPDAAIGSLPRAELAVLIEILRATAAADPTVWFAVWEGWGQLAGGPPGDLVLGGKSASMRESRIPEDVLRGPRLELPGRRYLLARGSLDHALALHDSLKGQSANLWWPGSHDWCVATEVDLATTYISGPHQVIEAVLASGDLEALRARPTDCISYDSDFLNDVIAEP